MGQKIESYIRDVRDFKAEHLPMQSSGLGRLGIKMCALVLSLTESNAWKSYPEVPGIEMAWDGPDLDQEILDAELDAILK